MMNKTINQPFSIIRDTVMEEGKSAASFRPLTCLKLLEIDVVLYQQSFLSFVFTLATMLIVINFNFVIDSALSFQMRLDLRPLSASRLKILAR